MRIALPKGRLLEPTAALVRKAGWELSDYSEGARLYNLTSARFPELRAKIFHEKDIPIQVAMGNYDLGICGLDWIQELMIKYPASGLVKVIDLGYGDLTLSLAAGRLSRLTSLGDIQHNPEPISIASEYPNLAESLALNCRCKPFNIFPVWGAAEIYPPENADLALLAERTGQELAAGNLSRIAAVLRSRAFLIANKVSWETQDLSPILESLKGLTGHPAPRTSGIQNTGLSIPVTASAAQPEKEALSAPGANYSNPVTGRREPSLQTGTATINPVEAAEQVKLALPDGHAQKHVVNILQRAGIPIRDYPAGNGNRRPQIGLAGFTVKVIRPQDMPLQVACGRFDAAITGRDWVQEHLYKFPASPVKELLDLKYSRVKIVAAMHNSVPAEDAHGLRKYAAEKDLTLRGASEYVSIADKFARDHHLGL